jgi:hypothetical protein
MSSSSSSGDKWRERLVQAHYEGSQSYDKAVMTLAGGALGVSLAFIRDIAPRPRHEWVLVVTWSFLTVSLLLIFASLMTSQKGLLNSIKELDEKKVTGGGAGKATGWLNVVAGASFGVGVGFLAAFTVANL